MSFFEDLGEDLGLLSLHDNLLEDLGVARSNHTFGGFSTDHHDDPMDIDTDGLASLHEETIHILEPLEQQEDSDSEEEHNSLLLSILSPTSLGVKYALNTRKLLMPPPDVSVETSRKSSVADLEFDTTNATRVLGSDRSTFDTVAVSSLFNSAQPEYTVELPTPIYENSMNRSFQYRRQMSPASYSVVHHHHYYGAQTGFQPYQSHQGSQGSQRNEYETGSGSRATEMEIYKNDGTLTGLSSLPGLSSQIIRQNKVHQLTRVHNDRSAELPSPWDSHAMPAERVNYYLSSYLQLVINVSLAGYVGHLILSIVRAIKQDIAHKLDTHASNLLVEIALCERSFYENNCQPETIVPALEKMCGVWEKCMNQDPHRGGNKSLISAQTIAMIVNSFFEPLSFKTLTVFALTLVTIFASNFAFGYVRAKSYYGWGQNE